MTQGNPSLQKECQETVNKTVFHAQAFLLIPSKSGSLNLVFHYIVDIPGEAFQGRVCNVNQNRDSRKQALALSEQFYKYFLLLPSS